eukprot:m.122206 g.122206  ORF g.122206 m.122206 type:complete len:134 (-) comp14420_c6_seq1:167-568(-)
MTTITMKSGNKDNADNRPSCKKSEICCKTCEKKKLFFLIKCQQCQQHFCWGVNKSREHPNHWKNPEHHTCLQNTQQSKLTFANALYPEVVMTTESVQRSIDLYNKTPENTKTPSGCIKLSKDSRATFDSAVIG